MSKFIEEYKESNRTIGILAFLMPPLAVILRNGKIKNRSVLVTFILTLMFWLPGVVYAFWVCFKICPSRTTTTRKISSRSKTDFPPLMRPTPTYPKANALLSFPTSQMSVVIHFHDQVYDGIQCKNETDGLDSIPNRLSSYIV